MRNKEVLIEDVQVVTQVLTMIVTEVPLKEENTGIIHTDVILEIDMMTDIETKADPPPPSLIEGRVYLLTGEDSLGDGLNIVTVKADNLIEAIILADINVHILGLNHTQGFSLRIPPIPQHLPLPTLSFRPQPLLLNIHKTLLQM